MFDDEFLKEGEKEPVLGPHYFDSRKVVERFMKNFEAEQFKPLVDKAAKDFQDRLWSDLEGWLLSDTESNLQGNIWRMVDDCVEALVGGKEWAIKRYALSDKYDAPAIRQSIATLIPVELQDARIKDLEAEVEKLKKDLYYARSLR